MNGTNPGDGVNRNEAIEEARVKRRDLSSALIDLEVAAQAPVGSGAWRGTMHLTLIRLGAAFAAHAIVADGEGGIIDIVVEDVPRLAAAADRLRAEHREIQDGIAAVTSEVEAIGTPTSAEEADEIRESLLEIFVALSRHRRHGSDFVWEAYDVDIGGGS
jgi:hypothetical protein